MILLKGGKSYFEAKRAVIGKNFLKAGQRRQNIGKGNAMDSTIGLLMLLRFLLCFFLIVFQWNFLALDQ